MRCIRPKSGDLAANHLRAGQRIMQYPGKQQMGSFSIWHWLIVLGPVIAAITFFSKGRQRASACAGDAIVLQGDGSYSVRAVGESHCQQSLSTICGGRTEDGHELSCVACLVPEPTNPHDRNAVMVTIDGHRVAYLPRSLAGTYLRSLRDLGIFDRAAFCQAIINGGWDRGDNDKGHFGVVLDLVWPIKRAAQ